MKKLFFLGSLLAIGLAACNSQNNSAPADGTGGTASIFKNINVEEFKAKMAGGDVVILDVRTPAETAAGKIEGAVEIDFRGDGFSEKVNQLDKEKTYLVYCKSGGRSGKTCDMMKKQGFREFYNLDGGYMAWSGQ